jgi:adenylyltransferase/sulfurtransferase
MIGCLQAIETMKLLLSTASTAHSKSMFTPLIGKQVYYDAITGESTTFELPTKDSACVSCGLAPSILSMSDTDIFLQIFSKVVENRSKLPEIAASHHISIQEFKTQLDQHTKCIIIDVRSMIQYSMVSLPYSECMNLPLKDVSRSTIENIVNQDKTKTVNIYVLCRRGIDSIRATDKILQYGHRNVFNVDGGLDAWRELIDPTFPKY